ncbi:MAG TPA: hypothetical protein VJU18_14100 [Vicinamibacteria bacterium]|nr:hypothetical protein [Vicinamibacteria bacterium]
MIRNTAVALSLVALAASGLDAQSVEPKMGERLASFEMMRGKRGADEVARRAAAVADLLEGKRLEKPPVVKPLRSPDGAERRWQVISSEDSALRIRYIPELDELRVLNTEVMADTHPEKDVGQVAALEIAKRSVARLAAAGVIEERHFDWKSAEVASTWVGEGSLDGRLSQRRRTEYRITLRRKLNGIELANAGLRVAVHVSGRLAGLRVGGVSVASDVAGGQENPKGRGQWLVRKVETADLERRFQRDAGPAGTRPEVAWARVMYVMPESRTEAVVEPLLVFSYSLKSKAESGEEVVSRRKVLGYSLTDPTAKAIDLVPPTRPTREGDVKQSSS